ncbi:MAG: hypothetical protein EAX96_00820 [Candidatus Lokiarchaeota archaeon]|nr:hypothetical protein [Candidatus Lokiarchaeota archaeon]
MDFRKQISNLDENIRLGKTFVFNKRINGWVLIPSLVMLILALIFLFMTMGGLGNTWLIPATPISLIGLLFLTWALFRRMHFLVISKENIYWDCKFMRKQSLYWHEISGLEKFTEITNYAFWEVGEDEMIIFHLETGKEVKINCSDFPKSGSLTPYKYISTIVEKYSGKRISPGKIKTTTWWTS